MDSGSRTVNLDALIAQAARPRPQSGTGVNLDALVREVKGQDRTRSDSGDPLEAFEAIWTRQAGRPPEKVRVGTTSSWRDTVMDLSQEGRRAVWSWEPDLTWYDRIIVNSSGGKDSMAALLVVRDLAERQGVLDRVWVVHCDLGRVEHPGTEAVAREHAVDLGLPFEVVVHRDAKTGRRVGLMERFEERMKAGGSWPGFGTRYCTSEFKTGRVSALVTAFVRDQFGPGNLVQKMGRRARVLNVLGLRAEESRARWGPPMKVKKENQTRVLVHEWLPVQGWLESEVWAAIKRSGLRPHPYYAQGGKRLSCRFCPLAGDEDLKVAGKLYPEMAKEYIELEAKYDKPFKEKRRLSDILGWAKTALGWRETGSKQMDLF